MKYMVLSKEKFHEFFKRLKTKGKIYAPVKVVKSHSFRPVESLKEMDLSYTRTWIPPKKFFLKPNEEIFRIHEDKGEVYEEIVEDEKIVVFGVHSCDIHALKLLDKVYLDEYPDRYYRVRRANTLIIGWECVPDEYCFCKSLGTNYVYDGFDLFFHELKDTFFVRVGSLRGNSILEENSEFFTEASAEKIEEFKKLEEKKLAKFKLSLNTHGLLDMLELAYDHPVWKEEADKCFGCGNCNLVCPTCRCYDVIDNLSLSLDGGVRIRRWDSCMLRKHGLVAGGLNFRPTRVERLRNRFNCKGSLREGMLNCVGCGRCTVYCPADINYVEVLKKIRGEI